MELLWTLAVATRPATRTESGIITKISFGGLISIACLFLGRATNQVDLSDGPSRERNIS